MKNTILKTIFTIWILSFLLWTSHASVIWPNIKVKLSSGADETYTTDLSGVGDTNTLIDLEVVWVFTSTSTGSYSISLPSGFEYVSYATTGTTCDNQNVTLSSNSGFSYTVAPTNQTCVSRFVLSYKITWTTVEQTHQISVFDAINFSNTSSLNLWVVDLADSTVPEWSSITYNWETNTGIVIQWNSGSNNYATVSNGSVTLSILWTDDSGSVSEMCISETIIANDTSCTSWESYATAKVHVFTTEWAKTVYIKFKDASSNISSVYSDTITWDKTEPTSSSSPDAWEFSNGSLSITLTCSDSWAWCDKVYYTTDGSSPDNLSSNVTSWTSISISGTNETKTLQFFSSDLASNTWASIESKAYVFSDSYVTFTSPTSLTNSSLVTLTGTCNNASGNNEVEYSLNSWAYTDVTTDTCEASNTWSSDITLSSNTSNTIDLRLKNNTNITSTTAIVHDDIAPTWSVSINSWGSTTTSTALTLTIAATDSVSVNEMCTSETALSSDDTCANTWESYSASKLYTVSSDTGTKTIYIKFRDTAWNVSAVYTDSITLESNVVSTPSSWGGGGGWGSSSSTKKYESYKNITKKKTSISAPISESIDNYSLLDISKLTGKKLTDSNATIRIKSHLKSLSYLEIYSDTQIKEEEVETLYPPHYYELIRDLKKRTLKVNNTDFSASNVKRFFHVWDEKKSVSFDKSVWLELNLLEEIDSVYVYFSDAVDGNFTLLKTGLKTDSEWVIKFKTKQLGYFAVIKSRYLWKQSFDIYKRIEDGEDSETEYITKVEQDGIEVYKTQYSKLSEKIEVVERLILGKFKKLYDAGKIPESTYKTAINNYNEFILHLSIYRMTKYKPAAGKALEAWKKFIKVYKIK